MISTIKSHNSNKRTQHNPIGINRDVILYTCLLFIISLLQQSRYYNAGRSLASRHIFREFPRISYPRWIMQISRGQARGILLGITGTRGSIIACPSRGHYSFVTRRLTATLSPTRQPCYVIRGCIFLGQRTTVYRAMETNHRSPVTLADAIIHYRRTYVSPV